MEKHTAPLPTVHPVEEKIVIFILLTILGLVVVGFLLVFKYKEHQWQQIADRRAIKSVETQITPETEVIVPSSSSPSAGVATSTYSNPEYKFTFTYPTNWAIVDTHTPKGKLTSSTIVSVNSPENKDSENEPYLVGSFSVTAIKKSIYTLDKLIAKYPSDFGGANPTISQRTINGIDGSEIEVHGTLGNTDRRAFFFEREDLIYEVDSVWAAGSTESDAVLTTILSSFSSL